MSLIITLFMIKKGINSSSLTFQLLNNYINPLKNYGQIQALLDLWLLKYLQNVIMTKMLICGVLVL